MKEKFINFYNKNNGKKLGGYSIKGTFAGEKESTIELLAYDNNIDILDIETKIELQ